jgi:hypothetical protein
MKIMTILAAALLFSTQAFAVSVGDKAVYNIATQGVTGTMTYLVTSISGSAVSYTSTILIQGQSQVQNMNTTVENLSQYATVAANCAQVGGTTQTITVAAGSLSVCHVIQNQNDISISGTVPFGIVKLLTSGQSGTISIELADYAPRK